ncbi:MAG: diacylglycerol kinase family lipid kinase [Lachnospiraceae bacterium]|nr:diacylglycerol kinase family lipid kinase [Lachnospiraceae bacterium]
MLYFIVNPGASTGRGRLRWQAVQRQLQEAGTEYRVFMTGRDGTAREIAARLTGDGRRKGNEPVTLVALGGDGTVNEILSGIQRLSGVTLGYIPAASGGDLAKALRISADPAAALERILRPRDHIEMDVGRIETESGVWRFAVSCGIGFDAAVCHEALHSSLKLRLNKLGLGKLTYGLIAVKQLWKLPRTDATLILDDTRRIRISSFIFCTVMNNRYEGGGFTFCPDAENNDGILDLCAAGNINKWRVFFLLPTALFGRHTRFAGIVTKKARKIVIRADIPLAIHADGESCGVWRELTAALEPERIRIIV